MTQLALHTKKLLLVDDEPELLSLLETVFKAEGFTNIVTALDVASTLDTFQKVQPDLAILDVSLPDGDGFTLCSYLRTLSKGTPVPVIFLTAKDETADRLMGLKSGADDYLTKPFPHKSSSFAYMQYCADAIPKLQRSLRLLTASLILTRLRLFAKTKRKLTSRQKNSLF